MGHQDDQTPDTGLPPTEYYSASAVTAPYMDFQGYHAIPTTTVAQPWGNGYSFSNFSGMLTSPPFGSSYDDFSHIQSFGDVPSSSVHSPVSSATGSIATTQQWGSIAMSPMTAHSPDAFAYVGVEQDFELGYNPSHVYPVQDGQSGGTSRSKRKPEASDVQKHAPPPSKKTKNKGKAADAIEPKPKKKDHKREKELKSGSKSTGKKPSPSSNAVSSLPTPPSPNSPNHSKKLHSSHRRDKGGEDHTPPPSNASDELHDFGDRDEDYDDFDSDGLENPTQRERNRMAATKCRAKTKAAVTQLEIVERDASDRREVLNSEAAALRSEVLFLRNMVLEHHSCRCVDKQNYIRNASELLGRHGEHNPIWGKDGTGGDWAEYHQPDCEYSQVSPDDGHRDRRI